MSKYVIDCCNMRTWAAEAVKVHLSCRCWNSESIWALAWWQRKFARSTIPLSIARLTIEEKWQMCIFFHKMTEQFQQKKIKYEPHFHRWIFMCIMKGSWKRQHFTCLGKCRYRSFIYLEVTQAPTWGSFYLFQKRANALNGKWNTTKKVLTKATFLSYD